MAKSTTSPLKFTQLTCAEITVRKFAGRQVRVDCPPHAVGRVLKALNDAGFTRSQVAFVQHAASKYGALVLVDLKSESKVENKLPPGLAKALSDMGIAPERPRPKLKFKADPMNDRHGCGTATGHPLDPNS